jgi:hypothetical protein
MKSARAAATRAKTILASGSLYDDGQRWMRLVHVVPDTVRHMGFEARVAWVTQ